jgi:hypothetical protein
MAFENANLESEFENPVSASAVTGGVRWRGGSRVVRTTCVIRINVPKCHSFCATFGAVVIGELRSQFLLLGKLTAREEITEDHRTRKLRPYNLRECVAHGKAGGERGDQMWIGHRSNPPGRDTTGRSNSHRRHQVCLLC